MKKQEKREEKRGEEREGDRKKGEGEGMGGRGGAWAVETVIPHTAHAQVQLCAGDGGISPDTAVRHDFPSKRKLSASVQTTFT